MSNATQVRIRGDMTPPEGAEHVGFHATRTGNVPIYEERVPVMVTRHRCDAAGKPLYRMNKYGQATTPVHETVQKEDADGRPVFERRRFIPADLGNGVVKKNYDFMPNEADVARAAAQQEATPEAVLARIKRVEAALGAAGLSMADADKLVAEQEAREAQAAERQQRGRRGS